MTINHSSDEPAVPSVPAPARHTEVIALRVALEEIVRLRLATDEGSLRVRADRMWELATAAIAEGK